MKALIFLFFSAAFFIFTFKVNAALIGDVNGDSKVDIVDIGIVIDNYGRTPIPNPNTDINKDSKVDIIDIGIVIDNYGATPPTPTPGFPPATPTTGSAATYTIAAVGDMVCGTADIGKNYPCQAGSTGNTIRKINPNYVLVLGDNQYESGSLSDFNKYYDAVYGSFKNITRPVAGNHEYGTPGAEGYFTYFGSLASPLEPACKNNCKGYYSFDIGNWHLVALNSVCGKVPGGCKVGSPQETWLKQDLARVPAGKCILAYMHYARYSSGHDGNTAIATSAQALWDALYAAKADIVLSGHSHNYERFDLQDANGRKTADGIRQFVVGTGGRDFTGFWNSTGLTNSQVKNNNTFGVLKLNLKSNSYDWQFIASGGLNGYQNGNFSDTGSQNCH